MQTQSLEKYCTRCSCKFNCNAIDIQNCQCSTVTISGQTQDFLKETRYDCLCSNCLQEIDNLVNTNIREQIKPENFIEGKHFYKENGFFVFTELYHYLKGTCCGNECRHCAYGLRKDKTIKQI